MQVRRRTVQRLDRVSLKPGLACAKARWEWDDVINARPGWVEEAGWSLAA